MASSISDEMTVDAPNSFAVFLNFHSSRIVSPLVIMVQMQVLSMMKIFPIQMLRSVYFYHQYAMGRQ